MYQKALGAVKDWPESIVNAWLDFERDEGTLEQLEFCEAKTKEKLEKVVQERQKVQAAAQPRAAPPPAVKKTAKRKSEETGRWKNLQLGSPSKQGKFEASSKPKLKESILSVGAKVAPPPGYKAPKEEAESKSKIAPPPGFKQKEDEKMEEDNSRNVDERITVFISNLDYTATEEEVRNALEPAGPITLFKMVKDFKGRSKGYCYVQLSSTVSIRFTISE